MPSPRFGRVIARVGVALRSWTIALARQWPSWIVVALACVLIWPGPLGHMPLSQDHTIHLARAWMLGEEWKGGHVSGWSTYWYFGFPLGELYPVLGDLSVLLLRAASFGLLPWAKCYGFVFAAGYIMQGLALLRVSRAMGLGPAAGVIAAALAYFDEGVLREGGWSYTVYFGVWLQPIACALIWWAVAEIAMIVQADTLAPRKLVLPAVLVCAALLAHPIALPMVALACAVMVLALGLRARMARVLVGFGSAVGLGGALAAWWVVPLFANRAWMANFGTLYSDLGTMVSRVATAGSWAKHMQPAVGYGIAAGLLWCVIRGTRFAKGLAVLAVLLWMMSTSDFFFRFRLDWLSESFRYLQYQRFIICAKPGLYLAGAALPVAAVRWGWARWRRDDAGGRDVAMGLGAIAFALAAGGAMMGSAGWAANKGGVGDFRIEHIKGDKRFEKDFAAFNEWARKKWEGREEYFRFAYKARRHSHVYADAPAYNHAPAYKLGYTPGEVFVHRPETEQASVLDRLRVKYVVGTSGGRGAKVVKRFGRIKVFERKVTEQVARIVGDGELEVLVDDADHERVSVQVTGATEGSRLEFNIAGYPRWQLLKDGVPVEWYEVPATGKGRIATQAERRAGEFRTGKGNLTPATDPMLLSVDAEDGVYELRYRHWMAADLLGVGLWAMAMALCAAMLAWPARAAKLLARIEGWLGPWVMGTLGAAVVVVLLARYAMGFRAESHLTSGWLRAGKADDVTGFENGPLKIDRLIGPAVTVDATADEPATMVLEGVEPSGDSLEGWFAVDDGDLKNVRGDFEFVIEGRSSGAQAWVQLLRVPIRNRGGHQKLDVPLAALEGASPIDLSVTVRGKSGKTARMGFDIDLR
ncbi:MAG: hypothetical protein IPK74_19025 [Deltaproteobacteria bacterium]|nr:hypothetical protein [Deltaproteobacteria bacterium]